MRAFALHFARRIINARALRGVSLVTWLALIAFGVSLWAQAAQNIFL